MNPSQLAQPNPIVYAKNRFFYFMQICANFIQIFNFCKVWFLQCQEESINYTKNNFKKARVRVFVEWILVDLANEASCPPPDPEHLFA